MDTTTVKPYIDALGAQKAKLEGYLTRGFQAIAIPAGNDEMDIRRKDFLTVSGIWFLILGVIGLIAGLAVHSTGIIVAGCAGLLSGAYVYIKGRQAMKAEAFSRLGSSIYNQIADVASNVSSQWATFMAGQNDSLKRTVVSAADSDAADKVALIDRIDSTPAVRVDLSGVQSELTKLGAVESLEAYRRYLPKAQAVISSAIATADGAQQTIYSTLSTVKAAS